MECESCSKEGKGEGEKSGLKDYDYQYVQKGWRSRSLRDHRVDAIGRGCQELNVFYYNDNHDTGFPSILQSRVKCGMLDRKRLPGIRSRGEKPGRNGKKSLVNLVSMQSYILCALLSCRQKANDI